jgi:hypothetical protein
MEDQVLRFRALLPPMPPQDHGTPASPVQTTVAVAEEAKDIADSTPIPVNTIFNGGSG